MDKSKSNVDPEYKKFPLELRPNYHARHHFDLIKQVATVKVVKVQLSQWSIAAADQLVTQWVPRPCQRIPLNDFYRKLKVRPFTAPNRGPNTPEKRPKFMVPEELRTTPRPKQSDIIYLDEETQGKLIFSNIYNSNL
jgi:hypothetical protein